MQLNDLQPISGARKARKRIGRGPGAGQDKTAGRGHNGQHARSGGYKKVGFEGGQMPLYRRVPKRGFRSRVVPPAEVRLDTLGKLSGDVDIEKLKHAGFVPSDAVKVKVIATGELNNPVNLKGVAVSAGARKAIEAAGGTIDD